MAAKDRTAGLYYRDYLQLDRLLSSQSRESERQNRPAHDEMLFITIHQAYELWFKQILFELDAVSAVFSAERVDDRSIAAADRGLGRIQEILRLLVSQIEILETMTPLEVVAGSVPNPDAYVVVDGYHAFMALPVDIGAIADRVFYIGGGYKYAMTGEGACFLHVPPGYGPRPVNTGWYAAFSALPAAGGTTVPYGADGQRFIGSTFDQTAMYRFVAVMDWAVQQGLTPAAIHRRGHDLQHAFVQALDARRLPGLCSEDLVVPLDEPGRGQFLVYRTPDAGEINRRLMDADIITDCRGDRLRFGFGVYHDLDEMPVFAARIAKVLG